MESPTVCRNLTATLVLSLMLSILPASAALAAGCGDGVTSSSETCDPPGSLTPTGTRCRANCTFCGDGIIQASGGESCDDANTVSGCRGAKSEKPLDACLRTCQRPICGDPSRIREYDQQVTGKFDVFEVHGRLISDIGFNRDINFDQQPFTIEVTRRVCSNDSLLACSADADCGGGSATCTDKACTHNSSVLCSADATCSALSGGSKCTVTSPACVVLRQSLPDGIPVGNPPRWRYRNAFAKTLGGIYSIKLQAHMERPKCAGGPWDDTPCDLNLLCPQADCAGYYAIMLRAYGFADLATADLQTRIIVGTQRWAARGVWRPSTQGWRFDKKDARLEPSS